MNLLKRAMIWILITVSLLVVWPFKDSIIYNDDIHTRRFCAYGHVYVEFEHNNKIWGTTYLGDSGKPMSCGEDDTLPELTTNRVNI